MEFIVALLAAIAGGGMVRAWWKLKPSTAEITHLAALDLQFQRITYLATQIENLSSPVNGPCEHCGNRHLEKAEPEPEPATSYEAHQWMNP